MGITTDSLVWLAKRLPRRRPLSMLELGNQHLHIGGPTKPAKPHFEQDGIFHVSVDLNGQDGARVADLCQPLDLGTCFDVVTDFGTSEHVADLWQCLQNVHNHVRVGGLIFHRVPAPGSWPGHGNWYRGLNFWDRYAQLCRYDVVSPPELLAACGNTTDGWETRVVLQRGLRSFPTRAEFDRLPLDTK